jgi:hypothetical protein
MDWPELTVCVCTYKRPWYAMLTLSTLNGMLGYPGRVRFHIADGGSPIEDLDYYRQILNGRPTTIEIADNLADMCNSCAKNGGDFWMTIMDDYALRYPLNVSQDVHLLMEHPEIGCVRMSRLAYTGDSSADLIGLDGLHWWRMDKAKTADPYLSSIGVHLYHRRFWDAYGDIPSCPPDVPGQAEINGINRFRDRLGPTIAIPMRFGEDWENHHFEPFWHLGTWRTDEYARSAGTRL